MSEQSNSFALLWEQFKDYATMRLEYCKFTVAEKVTLFVSAILLALLIGALCIVALFFLSLAGIFWIGSYVGLSWAFVIMASLYVIAAVVAILLRKHLIINNVCRFVSRLLLS